MKGEGGNNGRWKVEGVRKKERNVEIEVEENGRKEGVEE